MRDFRQDQWNLPVPAGQGRQGPGGPPLDRPRGMVLVQGSEGGTRPTIRDGDVRFIRITADPAQVDAPWWIASRVAQPDPNCAHRLAAVNASRTCIVMPRQAEAFHAWAASIFGWHEGLFAFEEIDLPEVLRAMGYLPAPKQGEVNHLRKLRCASCLRVTSRHCSLHRFSSNSSRTNVDPPRNLTHWRRSGGSRMVRRGAPSLATSTG